MASLVLGLAGAWAVSRWGRLFGLVDLPSARSSHHRATLKGGGIGIAAGVLFSAVWAGMPFLFWSPVLGIALLGLAADRFDVAVGPRLLVEFALAGMILGALDLPRFGVPFWITAPLLAVFLVGTANFYNFMDGINGIAGLSGLAGFVLLAWHGILTGGDPTLCWLALAAAAACLGFLPFNIPVARVFMGDAGSLLLGFLFAAIAVAGSRNFLDLTCRAAFLLPFYLDELTTMALRIRDGESLTRPHRRHFYQLLANEMNVAHWKVALGYAAAQWILGLFILRLMGKGPVAVFSLLTVCSVGFLYANITIRKLVGRCG